MDLLNILSICLFGLIVNFVFPFLTINSFNSSILRSVGINNQSQYLVNKFRSIFFVKKVKNLSENITLYIYINLIFYTIEFSWNLSSMFSFIR